MGYVPKATPPSTRPNYASWGWKQIEAAINGGSELAPGSSGAATAQGLSNPQTLWDAGDAFEFVRQTLVMVAQSLQDQAKALAGGSGAPWQGEAANAFYDTMSLFSQQVSANAEVLDGSGTSGTSVPQQLVDNGNHLLLAQAKITAIDKWYAQQAVNLGASVGSNGLVAVSTVKGIDEMMTHDMYTYGLMPLVGSYEVSTSKIVSPNPSFTNLGPDSGSNGPASQDSKSSLNPNVPPSASNLSQSPKNLAAIGGPNVASSGLGSPNTLPQNLARLPTSSSPVAPQSLPASRLAQSLPASRLPQSVASGANHLGSQSPGLAAPSAVPFPGGVSPQSGDPGRPSGLGGTSLPSGIQPLPANGVGTSGLPPEVSNGAIPPLPGRLAVSPDNLGSGLSDMPGTGLSKGLGSGLGTSDGALTDPALKNLTASPSDAAGSASGVPGESGVPGQEVGGEPFSELPMMPGAGGMGLPGAAGAERSDASGLLGGEDEPWLQTNAADDMLPGAVAGGSGLTGLDGAGANGLETNTSGVPGEEVGGEPFSELPMMPGAGGVGLPGAAGAERSDASGLLGGEDEPWLEDEIADAIVTGTFAGGVGLTGLEADASAGTPQPGIADEQESPGTDPAEQPGAADLAATAVESTEAVHTVSADKPDNADEAATHGHRHHRSDATVAASAEETHEDFAAWDSALAGAAVLMSATSGGSKPDDPPEDPSLAKWQRVPLDPGAEPVTMPGSEPRAASGRYAVSGDHAEEQTAAEGEEEGEEEEVRGATALLVEDVSLWGTWQSDPGALS